MRKFLISLILFSIVCGNDLPQSNYHTEIHALIKKLAIPFDLYKSVYAIAVVESEFGRYNINLKDPSCGITHININTYMKRHNLEDTVFNRNKACQDLINSPALSVANTIEELLYWQEQHCKNNKCTQAQWLKVWASYNAGWNYDGKQGQTYARKIQELVRKVK